MTPTALDIAGVAPPPTEAGVPQDPIQGVSLTYAFADAAAPTRHREQYYFLLGSAAMVKDGWKATSTTGPTGWTPPGPSRRPNTSRTMGGPRPGNSMT